jgi:twitching motility protein PilT
MKIEEIISAMRDVKYSDLHVRVGSPIAARIFGDIKYLPDYGVIEAQDMIDFRNAHTSHAGQTHWNESGDSDSAMTISGMRLRAAFYKSDTGESITFRRMNDSPPNLKDLNAPSAILKALEMHAGMVLVTGPTGSGKTTTLAAMVNHLVSTKPVHVLTLEDPIEYRYESSIGLVSQRQIGRDSGSFASGLRAALREDPDIILIGEMRDPETISLALAAAETGHLVLGTLHTRSAAGTISRIVDTMPSEQQNVVRTQLADALKMVVSQQLIQRSDGQGRVGAYEMMITNTPISNLIREGKLFQIESFIQMGKNEGMQTMEHAVSTLKSKGMIR